MIAATQPRNPTKAAVLRRLRELYVETYDLIGATCGTEAHQAQELLNRAMSIADRAVR